MKTFFKNALIAFVAIGGSLYFASCSDDVKYVLPENGTGVSRYKDTLSIPVEAGDYALPFQIEPSMTISLERFSDNSWVTLQQNSDKPLSVKANDLLLDRCATVLVTSADGRFTTSVVVRQQGAGCKEEIHVNTPGQLAALLGDRMSEITSLKVTGELNEDDLLCLKRMMRGVVDEELFDGHLAALDLSEAKTPEELPESIFCMCQSLKSIILPQCVTVAGEDCFYECANLEQVVLPEHLQVIKNYAFSCCYSLKDIRIPSTVKVIGESAFSYCRSLESIVVPEGVKELEGTFYRCMSLKSIVLPSTLEVIEDRAFAFTTMTTIRLPESLKVLGEEAFYKCMNLCEVQLPEGLEVISNWAFQNCRNLKYLEIPASVGYLSYCVFEHSGISKLVFKGNISDFNVQCFSGMNVLQEIVFSPDQTIIPGFYESPLLRLKVPAKVTAITDIAFYEMKELWLECTEVVKVKNVADSMDEYLKIYVPASLLEAYKQDAVWSQYADHFYAMPVPSEQ